MALSTKVRERLTEGCQSEGMFAKYKKLLALQGREALTFRVTTLVDPWQNTMVPPR